MAFPWKKVKKNTRISQLLSNQIHHRRKGGGSPLVVETGFPTSLIDLFVKNKERLKKKKKNNNNKNNKPCSSPPSPPRAASPPPPPPPSPDSDDVNVDDSRPLRDGIGSSGDEGEEGGVSANGVLVSILKMFFVVVSVLGTKKLVVGITISAFVLVFLECLAKHVGRLSLSRFRNRHNKPIVDEEDEEIHGKNQEIECEEEEEEEEHPQREIEGLDLVLPEGNNNNNNRKYSRGARLKLKMKELVRKKLRYARKKDRGVVEVEDGATSDVSGLRSSSVSRELVDDDDDQLVVAEATSMMANAAAAQRGEGGVKTEDIFGCLILLLIVLVGLVGGRIPAVILTLAWCLMQKSRESLTAYLKFPLLRWWSS